MGIIYKNLHLKEWTLFEDAILPLNRRGLTVIGGRHVGTGPIRSNGAGKSLLVSAIPAVWYGAGPAITNAPSRAKRDTFYRPKSRVELSLALNDAPIHIVKRAVGKSIRYDVDVEGQPMEFTTATSAEKWLSTIAPSPELFYSTVYLDSRRPGMAFHAPANRFDMISALMGLDAFDRVRDHLQQVRTEIRKGTESIEALQSRMDEMADEMADLEDMVGPMTIDQIMSMRKMAEKAASRRMLAKDLIQRASGIPEVDRIPMRQEDVKEMRQRASKMMDEDRARDAYSTWRQRFQRHLESRGNAVVEMAAIDPPAEGERDRLVSNLAIASATQNLIRRMRGTDIQDRCPHCEEWIPLRHMLASWVSRFMPTSHKHARKRIAEVDRYTELHKEVTATIRSERPRRLFGKISGKGALLMRRVQRATKWMKILADSRRYGVDLNLPPTAERVEDMVQLEVAARRLIDLKKDMAALKDRIRRQQAIDKKVKAVDAMVSAYGPSGLKRLACAEHAHRIEAGLNDVVRIMDKNMRFILEVGQKDFRIFFEDQRRQGTFDVRNLSGAESRCFTVFFLIALLPLIKADMRSNLLVLDEVDVNLDYSARDRYVNGLLPELLSIVPHVIVVTPFPENYPEAEHWTVIRDGDTSSLMAGTGGG